MAIIVQITTGPWSGRKTYLRSGQMLRFGRTEWADFPVPHDAAMSEIHFALQYDSYQCRLRDLNSGGGTLLNGKKVTEAVVQHGDKITAGATSFSIQIEGAVLDTGMEISAAALAAAGQAARVSEPTGSSGYLKVEPPKAATVALRFKLDDDAQKLLTPQQSCREFYELLVKRQLFADALRFLAHALPKREAVWWTCAGVGDLCAQTMSAKDTAALVAAKAWVVEPTEEHRQTAMAAAEATHYETAGGWAAAAAAWTGGSLAPPDFPPVPPGEFLTAQAVVAALTLAAVAGEPKAVVSRYQALLALGAEVADAKNVWPQGKS